MPLRRANSLELEQRTEKGESHQDVFSHTYLDSHRSTSSYRQSLWVR